MANQDRLPKQKCLTGPRVLEQDLSTRLGNRIKLGFETRIIYKTEVQNLRNVKNAELIVQFEPRPAGTEPSNPILLFGKFQFADSSSVIKTTNISLIQSQILYPRKRLVIFNVTKFIQEFPSEEFYNAQRLVNVIFDMNEPRMYKTYGEENDSNYVKQPLGLPVLTMEYNVSQVVRNFTSG